ncbi:uncharacterized protein LOC105662606 [Megachile rotundata]|uniref:uncharacterized protein LOC105662606 n=1 Tax=Megachile rotundata TaxID=143995 RepID=UPI003FD20EC0
MENSFTVTSDDDTNEEWSSFCSSCKSILQTTFSTEEPSFLRELIDELFEKNKTNRQIEKKENIRKNINTINLEINTDELNNDIIKETKLNQKLDEKENSIVLNTQEHGIILINNSNNKTVLYNETLRNLMSLRKSQNKTNYNTRKNILDYHRKIVKLTESILHLSNCINVMRKIILEEIHKKTTSLKKSKDTMSRFYYSHN